MGNGAAPERHLRLRAFTLVVSAPRRRRKVPMFRLLNVNGRAALERDGEWYDLVELSGDAALADPLAA